MTTALPCGVFAAVVVAGAYGCLDGPAAIAPDTAAPSLRVVSPVDTAYDVDGDKLVDLRIEWADSNGAVDLASVRLRSLGGVNGTADSATDLLGLWRIERLDDSGLVVHETLAELLHGGANQLELTVADTSGNVRTDTVAFTLPYGALYTTIVTGLTGFTPANGLVLCPDDNRLYMTAGRSIVVLDPDSLSVIAVVPDPHASDDLSEALCVSGDPVLYVTHRVERFDRPSMTWLSQVAGSFLSHGLAQSRANQDILYAGEGISGTVAVVSRSQDSVLAHLLPISSPKQEYVFDIAVLGLDEKLYLTRITDGGVMAMDPGRDSVLKLISVAGVDTWGSLGRTDAIKLRSDGTRLYAAVIDGLYPGLAEINTQSDSAVRFLLLLGWAGIDLALSPSERRIFLTTADRGTASENVLIDLASWTVIASFPRPRVPGVTRADRDVVFHTSGKLVFVARDRDVDVYLNRE